MFWNENKTAKHAIGICCQTLNRPALIGSLDGVSETVEAAVQEDS